MSGLQEQLKTIEKELQGAQLEVGLREKQLSELRPKRLEMERECQEKYNCQITELKSNLSEREAALEKQVEDLAADIELAKQ